MTQLDLFKSSEIDLLKQELAELRQRQENARRGLFARHNELSKLYMKLQDELDAFKFRIYNKNHPNVIELEKFVIGK